MLRSSPYPDGCLIPPDHTWTNHTLQYPGPKTTNGHDPKGSRLRKRDLLRSHNRFLPWRTGMLRSSPYLDGCLIPPDHMWTNHTRRYPGPQTQPTIMTPEVPTYVNGNSSGHMTGSRHGRRELMKHVTGSRHGKRELLTTKKYIERWNLCDR